VPRGVHVPSEWRDRAEIVVGRLRGHVWEQLELPARADCDVLLHPANTAPVRAGPPSVLVLHDIFPLTRPDWYSPAFASWYRLLIPAITRRSTHVLTTSPASARAIETRLDIDPAKISIVSQGLAPFDRPLPSREAEALPGRVSDLAPFVLAPGAGDRRKNTTFARHVLEEDARRFGASPVLVVFGAASSRVLRRDPAVSPAGDHVTLGRVDDRSLHALYSGAAAVLCPAHDEGFGRVPLEAMACGAPCIVAEHDAAAAILADTPARRLPLDVSLWAETLQQVLESGERVTAAARDRLRRRWSWDGAAHEVLAACTAARGHAAPTSASVAAS
jgi:glycosyltransferase involved in cell wall biosynthesis